MSWDLLLSIVFGAIIFSVFVCSFLFVGKRSDENMNKIMEEENESKTKNGI